jgi:uncharacterized protein YqgV (UPF0045/DUF77 family)
LRDQGYQIPVETHGTIIEESTKDEAFNAVKADHKAPAKKGMKRIVTHLTIDDRRDSPKGMTEKVEAVKSRL